MTVGVLFMAEIQSSQINRSSPGGVVNKFQKSEFESNAVKPGQKQIENVQEKEKKNIFTVFPIEGSSSGGSSNNSSRKSSVNHSNRSGSSSSSNNSIDTKTRTSTKKFQRSTLQNVLLGPVDLKHAQSFPSNFHHHALATDQIGSESSVGDPIFYYIKSSHDCPCAYHDQVRRIDEERAIRKQAKLLSKKDESSTSATGSFYVSSNSSSVSSLDYETPNTLREELARFHPPNEYLLTETALIHHGQFSPKSDKTKKIQKNRQQRMHKVQSDLRDYRNRNIPSPIIENKISRIRLSKSPSPEQPEQQEQHVLRLVLTDNPGLPESRRHSVTSEAKSDSTAAIDNLEKGAETSPKIENLEIKSRPRLPEPAELDFVKERKNSKIENERKISTTSAVSSKADKTANQPSPENKHQGTLNQGKSHSDQDCLSESSSPPAQRQRSVPPHQRISKKRRLHRISIALPQPEVDLSKDFSVEYESMGNDSIPIEIYAAKGNEVNVGEEADKEDSTSESELDRSPTSSPYAASGYVTSIAVIPDDGYDVSGPSGFGTKAFATYDPTGNWTLKPKIIRRDDFPSESSEEEMSSFESEIEDESYISVLPSNTPIVPDFAATLPRSNPVKISSSWTAAAPNIHQPPSASQPKWQSTGNLKTNQLKLVEEEIHVCPPSIPENKTCYTGDLQTYLNRENPELPLCLQNIILQHVQNAATNPDSKADKKMKKKMSKLFVVPEDPSHPVAFTETFPDVKRKPGKRGRCCSSSPVHKIVGIFTFLMSVGIMVTIICVYHFTDTFRPMMMKH